MQLTHRIGRRLRLQDLHVLLTVIQSGSMGKAAKALNTSQPNVSRSIADLERTIGYPLLDRGPRGINPTPFGRALLNSGLAVFDDLRQGIKTIEFLADPTIGDVHIGCNYFLAGSFIPAVIENLSHRHPGLNFHIVAGDTRSMMRKLQDREVDLLVAWKPGRQSGDDIAFETLYDNSVAVVAGEHNPWTRRRKVRLEDICDEPWALPPADSDFGAIARRVFATASLPLPRATVFTFAPDVRMSFLSGGRFLTLCAHSVFRFPRKRPDVKILPVEVKAPQMPIGVATLKNRTISPAAGLFIERARDLAKA